MVETGGSYLGKKQSISRVDLGRYVGWGIKSCQHVDMG
jgi:hypothetical protein